ncbi:MAG: O-antigen ligase family protein [Pirellulaceae bacterium]
MVPWVIGGNYPFVRSAILGIWGLLLVAGGLFGLRPRLLNCLTLLGIVVFSFAGLQLAGSGNFGFENLGSGPHTVCWSESEARIIELLIPFLTFVLGLALFNHPHRVDRFFVVVLGLGMAVSFFGIAQRLAWNGRVYWFYELLQGGLPFGPFVNRNNAGGFLLICLGAVFYFLARAAIVSQRERAFADFIPNRRKSWLLNFKERFLRGFASVETTSMYVLIASIIIVLGVVASLSRGAIVGLFISAALGMLLIVRVRPTGLIFASVVFLLAMVVAIWSEQLDAIQGRVDSLVDIQEAAEPRFAHWRTVWPYVCDNWVWGSGLGTYRLAYPEYQTETMFTRWFQHAENQYLEALAECGIAGLTSYVAIFVVGFLWCLGLLRQKSSTSVASGVAGCVVLSGQMLTSFFDFGLFQPANQILFASVLAAIYGQKKYVDHLSDLKHGTSGTRTAICSVFTTLATVLLGAIGIGAAYNYLPVDCREMAARYHLGFEPAAKMPVKDLEQSEQLLNYAKTRRPQDPFVHFELGKLNVLKYRVSEFDRLWKIYLENDANRDPSTPEEAQRRRMNRLFGVDAPLTAPVREVWQVATITNLHRLGRFLFKQSKPDEFQKLAAEIQGSPLLHAYADFQQAIAHWPKLGRFYFPPAELAVLMGDSPEVERKLADETLRLCPTDPEALFNIGLLFHNSGDDQNASALWNRVLRYTRKYDESIINICRNEMPAGVFLKDVLPEDPDYLFWMTQKYFSRDEDVLPRRMIMGHTEQIIKKLAKTDATNYYWIGELHRFRGNLEAAVENLTKAVAAEPQRFRWRLSLVYALRDQKRWSEAREQLKRCKLLQDANQELVIRLLNQIRRLESREMIQGLPADTSTPTTATDKK